MPTGVYTRSLSHNQKISRTHKINGVGNWMKGRIIPKETREKISKTAKKKGIGKWMFGRKGATASNWKGGLTEKNTIVRNSAEYSLWREAVFKRDNFTCIWCGDNTGGNLNADHIKPFSDYPELRLAVDNGRTLCEKCHKTTETWGSKILKLRKKNI